MREEQKSEIIHDALQFLDDELIEDVDALRNGMNPSKQEKGLRTILLKRKWVAVAASICVIILACGIWEYSSGIKPSLNENVSDEMNKDDMQEGFFGEPGANEETVEDMEKENEFFEDCENMNATLDKEEEVESTEDTETEE